MVDGNERSKNFAPQGFARSRYVSSGAKMQTKNTPVSEGASEILRFRKYTKTQPGEELLWVLDVHV
jgi:hypothetical protein